MAAQRPSIRPWSRLASIAARPAPVPTPTPQINPVSQPRPSFTRPAFRTTVPLPTQPQQSVPVPPAVIAPPAAPRAQTPPTPKSVTFTPAPESRSPPVTVTSVPPLRSPPTAVSPAPVSTTPRSSPTTVVSSTATPLSPLTAVISSHPPPAAERHPITPPPSASTTSPIIRTSPSTLSTSSAAPKASPVPSSYSVQQSPKPKVSATFSPLQNSAAPKQVSPVQAPSANTTTASPNFINPRPSTLTPSSDIRPIIHPPSPLTLPPAQLKFERNIPREDFQQKYVIVQETKEKQRVHDNNSNSNQLEQNIFKDKSNGTERLNSEDLGIGLLTIAGDNKGAIMEFSHSRRKHDSGKHLQSPEKTSMYSTWREGYKSGNDSSEEGKSRNSAIARRKTTFMNSNVQGVNNSVLYNVSYTHHDPGVQYSQSR